MRKSFIARKYGHTVVKFSNKATQKHCHGLL